MPLKDNGLLDIESLPDLATLAKNRDVLGLKRLQERIVKDIRSSSKIFRKERQFLWDSEGTTLPDIIYRRKLSQEAFNLHEAHLAKLRPLRTKVAVLASRTHIGQLFIARYGQERYSKNRMSKKMVAIKKMLKVENLTPAPGDQVVVQLPEGIRLAILDKIRDSGIPGVTDYTISCGGRHDLHVPHFLVCLYRRGAGHLDRDADQARFDETQDAWSKYTQRIWQFKERRSYK